MQETATRKIRSRETHEAYLDLRIRMIQRGFTLRSFAMSNGYPVPSVYMAARGLRAGIKSVKILNHLKQIAYATAQ